MEILGSNVTWPETQEKQSGKKETYEWRLALLSVLVHLQHSHNIGTKSVADM